MDRPASPGSSWQSPAAMPRRWLAGIFAVSALYAIGVAVISTTYVHQTWGIIAACGYGLATVAALIPRQAAKRALGRDIAGSDIAVVLAFCGGLVIPLCWLVARGLQQPEVMVIARSGAGLIHHGTPYPGAAALAGTSDPNAYNPYLPVMSLFGVPRALVDSPLTDPRIWFSLAFVIVFWLALRRAGAWDPARWTVLVAGCPVIAFTLATGGDDAPMIAFLCLGFAYLWPTLGSSGEDRVSPVAAGLALGIAAAMKATAWPAVAVAIALLAVTRGRRAVARFTLTAVAIVAVFAGPFLASYPRALVENTIEFPLGFAHVVSAAASPLPGHLIAETGHAGHTIVVVALILAGLAVAAVLVFRPPHTVPRAMTLLAGAMTLMFLLAPSTRYGYFIYPLTLMIWLLVAMAGRRQPDAGVIPDPGERVTSSRTGN
jgi:glycosyl transferase family 87